MSKKFEYKYTSPSKEERKEIEYIQKQYLEPTKKERTKLDRLRELDFKVKEIPVIISLALGIIGTLIFGLGLTMILEWNLLVWGILVMVVACVPMSFAYFSHNKLYAKLKNKYSNEIIKLSKELLNENDGKES